MHTQEHVGFNASAQHHGHDVDTLDRYTDQVIQTARKIFAAVVSQLVLPRKWSTSLRRLH